MCLDKKVTSNPISADTKGGDMVPAVLMCENTNLEKLVCTNNPILVKYLSGGNVVGFVGFGSLGSGC